MSEASENRARKLGVILEALALEKGGLGCEFHFWDEACDAEVAKEDEGKGSLGADDPRIPLWRALREWSGEGCPAGVLTSRLSAIEMDGFAEEGHPGAFAVRIDSREIKPGDIFVAIKGENTDGHKYARKAVAESGALLVIATSLGDGGEDGQAGEAREGFSLKGVPGIVKVDDATKAMGAIANAWRRNLAPKALAITGSCGKTTLRSMCHAMLAEALGENRVHATSGNHNNQLGLPMTILEMPVGTTHLVAETGMNHFGELELLSSILEPDVAVVNNALRAHIGCGFESEADIAKAKGEIFSHLSGGKIAILPLASRQFGTLFAMAEKGGAKKIRTFASSVAMEEAEARGDFAERDGGAPQSLDADFHSEDEAVGAYGSKFTLVGKMGEGALASEKRIGVEVPLPGKENISNAVAAMLACNSLDPSIPLEKLASGLARMEGEKGRLRFLESPKGFTVIDDTYNANPDSMRMAIDVLGMQKAPRWFVMGDMGELGPRVEKSCHEEVGDYFASKDGMAGACFLGPLSLDAFYAAQKTLESSSRKDGEKPLIKHFESMDEIVKFMLGEASDGNLKGGAVIVKGSRYMRMERLVAALMEN